MSKPVQYIKNGLIERIGGRAQYKHNYIVCEQVINFELVVRPFLLNYNFRNVIEIGTARGGFTYFLAETLPEANIITYDIMSRKELRNEYLDSVKNIKCFVNSPFTNNNDGSLTIKDTYFSDFLTRENLLVVCDGGNKVEELKCIAPHLKSNDFIMYHDYGASESLMTWLVENHIWINFEIKHTDVKSILQNNNLLDVHQELNYVVWGCAKKMS